MSALGHLNLSGRKLMPAIVAAEAAECGLACMAMIAAYHGHDVDLNGLRQRFPISLAGASLRSLMGIADQLGFSTRALRVEIGALGKVHLPAIIHWDLNHFVVLKSVGRRSATIHDPAVGIRSMRLAEFSRHFSGVVLEVARAEGFEPISARAPMKLSFLWSRLRGSGSALAQVLLLSVALQVVAFAMPFQLQLVVDEVIAHNDRDLLPVIALAFGGLVLLQATIEALRGWALRVLGHLLSFQITGNLVRHVLRLPSDYFEKRHVGDIVSRLQSVRPIQSAISQGVVGSIIDGAMAFVAALVMFFYSVLLAVVVILAVLINMAIGLAIFPRMRQRMEEEILAQAREQSHLMETIRAAVTVKLMGREGEREGRWRNLHAESTNAGVAVGRFQIAQRFAQQLVTGLQTVLVIYLGARLVMDGQGFSIGMLFAFMSFRQTFTDRAVALLQQVIEFRFLRLHLDRLSDIVTTPAEGSSDVPALTGVEGRIRLKNVSFRYGTTDPYVFEDLNLEVRPGDFVAITGASGGGKTTLLKIMLGLNRPTDGSIELDGYAATPERWRSWREHIGVVAQDDFLLSGTVADNIACFDPDLDMPRVMQAAAAAQVHADIQRAPMQYMSLVGDMGSTMSGGQRQRILLARALYRRPKVLFLDEGTANLDEKNEELIADLIAQLPITRIVVAHRPALIRRASIVYEVGNRQIAAIRDWPAIHTLTPATSA